jgi:O-antigen ligase
VAGGLLIGSARRPEASSEVGSIFGGALRARLDLLGLVLVGALIGWTQLVGAWPGFSPGPFTGLLLACTAAFVIGRLVASVGRTLVPAAVVAGAGVLAVTTPDILSGTALGGPLGYANANGAFFVQAAMAGVMLAAASRATPLRILGLAAAVAFGVVPFAAKSVTSAALLLSLPVVALSALALAGGRVAVASGAAAFIVALAATMVLGSTYNPGDRSSLVDRIVDTSIDERRAALWHEALVMMSGHPTAGVGLGGFQVLSPTARSDPDARWAHNGFLQRGAETGLVGFTLLTLLFVWGFANLGVPGKPDAVSVLGAVALGALGIHACVDYILHFSAVPITAAALVGAATPPR